MATKLTKLKVGTAGIALGSGVTALLMGITQVQEVQFTNKPISLSGTGTSTSQIVGLKQRRVALTATGGLAKYNTLTFSNPESFTGAITGFCIEVAVTPSPTTKIDVGVVTDASTGTGTGLFDNLTLSRGVHCADVTDTTEVLFGPDERIKAGGLTGSGQGLDAEAWIQYREVSL